MIFINPDFIGFNLNACLEEKLYCQCCR